MPSLYTHRSRNIRKTWMLFGIFLAVVIGIGWFFAQVYGRPIILYLALGFSLIMNLLSYWYSDKIVLKMSGAIPLKKENHPELFRLVENLCITAGLPMPKLYLVKDKSPNAFATGRNPQNSAIAVTEGLIEILDRSELEGVLAHELSHIGNRDILVSTVAVILVGIVAMIADIFLRSLFWFGIGSRRDREVNPFILLLAVIGAILAPLAATLLQLAISRKREFLADASGALLTRYPEGLAQALEKIASYPYPLRYAKNATAHLWFENPFKGDRRGQKTSWFTKLFMTHPPIEERIKALRGMR